jgi:host factor-I protein
MSGKNNIQDLILNSARKDKVEITIYLTSGFPLKGRVKSFDNFTIILEQNGKQFLIYKHAISTIQPSQKISLNPDEKDEDASETGEE